MVHDISAYQLGYLVGTPPRGGLPSGFSSDTAQAVHQFHRRLPGYDRTRLVPLSRLARRWGVSAVSVKDESTRFGLKAFKVLGSSYAVAQLMCRKLGKRLGEIDFQALAGSAAHRIASNMTLTTATDGNHGRGVAWTAQQLGQKAVIYMPKGSVESRVQLIESHGARVEVTAMNYDDTVRLTRDTARQKGWYLIQDTAWEGYTEIPLWIMQGYMTMCTEAADQMAAIGQRPTHVFVQAGVGSLAAAVVGYLSHRYAKAPPRFIVIEPNNAACFLASAAAGDGRARNVSGDLDTIMAGLACGEPSTLAWEVLRDRVDAYVRCGDAVPANGIRILANPLDGDTAIEAGESGSVGIGLLDLICSHRALEHLKAALAIGPNSSLLVFNTEGATDPSNRRDILWYGKWPLPERLLAADRPTD
jgi:diaminopropionate ammonia-lyase